MSFFRGYVPTKNKQCLMQFNREKVADNELLTLEEAQELKEYAGILDIDAVLIDVDDMIQSEKLMKIVEDKDIRCRVYKSTRGMHFVFKNVNRSIKKCYTGTHVSCGLSCDIKCGCKNSYEILKYQNVERKIIYDILEDEEYEEVPFWLLPVKDDTDFNTMTNGSGRNQALFNYILKLQKIKLSKEQIRECLKIINDYVLIDKVSEDELNVIMRDEAFTQEVNEEFFANEGKTFLFDKFSEFLMNTASIKMINGSMYIFKDRVYVQGSKFIEQEMIKRIPRLNNAKRTEVLKYLELIVPEVQNSDAYNIAFKNGVYNVSDDTLNDFTDNIVITNLIPHNYNADAYSEIADKTLNKLACNDEKIRMLLEEVIGYCFFRRNELRKAFILLGDKKNGKSTFIDMLTNVLGEDNVAALDLKEIGDKFLTAEISGVLANLGDDIDDEYITSTAIFKKVVSGDTITVQRKGGQPYKIKPYCKNIFSANEMPRIKDKTGAVLDRLVPVPFNNTFSKDDADFDPYIKYKLQNEECMEYLVKVGIEGLKRVLKNKEFTINEEIKQEQQDINERNNPILLFLKEIDESDIEFKVAKDVYTRYDVWCLENGYQQLSYNEFTKIIKKKFNMDIQPRKILDRSVRVFIKKRC